MFKDKYGLTKAVLEGRKTMTRMIVPECKELDILRHWEHNEGAIATGYEEKTQSFRFDYCPDKKRRYSIDHLNLIPRYKVGEVVAVAQAYRDIRDIIGDVHDGKSIKFMPGWSNKMFVRADLMPYQIRITNVRVERLQDISDDDCLREGIHIDGSAPDSYQPFYTFFGSQEKDGTPVGFHDPRYAFEILINKISGKGTWDRNPWVFVYEFELVK